MVTLSSLLSEDESQSASAEATRRPRAEREAVDHQSSRGHRTPFGFSFRPRDALATDRPWKDWVFWILQVSVIAIYLIRLGIEVALGGKAVPDGDDLTTIAIFI